jgi:hypothetical protein
LPKPSFVGKLGQANGSDIAWVRRAAELRRALKGDYGFEIEDPDTEPSKIEAQSAVPPPTLKNGLPAFTTGSHAESDEPPPAPPPPNCYDGPDDDIVF